MQRTPRDLERVIAFWANDEAGKHLKAEEHVRSFVSSTKSFVDHLRSVDHEIELLQEKRLLLAEEVLKRYASALDGIESDEGKHALIDLIFWEGLKKTSKDLYGYLQPRWESVEHDLLQRRLRLQKLARDKSRVQSLHQEDMKKKESKDGET